MNAETGKNGYSMSSGRPCPSHFRRIITLTLSKKKALPTIQTKDINKDLERKKEREVLDLGTICIMDTIGKGLKYPAHILDTEGEPNY